MSNKKSFRTSIFCLISELQDWLIPICKEGTLEVSIIDDFKSPLRSVNLEEERISSTCERMFIHEASVDKQKPLVLNDIKSIEWGWIDITLGNDDNGILLLTDIQVTSSTSSSPTWKALMSLKKQLRKESGNRVLGKNIQNGGESVYKDIWYTPAAEKFRMEGGVWKQFVSGNAIFEPIIGDSR